MQDKRRVRNAQLPLAAVTSRAYQVYGPSNNMVLFVPQNKQINTPKTLFPQATISDVRCEEDIDVLVATQMSDDPTASLDWKWVDFFLLDKPIKL